MATRKKGKPGRMKRATANVTSVTAAPTPVRDGINVQLAAQQYKDMTYRASPQGQIQAGLQAGIAQPVSKFFTTGAGRMMDYGSGVVKTVTQTPGAAMRWAGGVVSKPKPPSGLVATRSPSPVVKTPTQSPLAVPATYEATKPLNKTLSNVSVAGNLSVGGRLQKAKKTTKRKRKGGKRKRQMGIGAIGMVPGVGGAPVAGSGGEAGFRQAASSNYMVYEDEKKKYGR